MQRKTLACFVAFVALVLAVRTHAQQHVWTVDDDGPADFSSIAAAVAGAAAGDILLVASGSYGAFTLEKRLRILGPTTGATPVVNGLTMIRQVNSCTLSGLRFANLWIKQTSGLIVVDDCQIGFPGVGSLTIETSDQVLVSRCQVLASTGGTAASVSDTNAVFVDCELHGGAGASGWAVVGNGGDGLSVANASHVSLAGSKCRGGDAGIGFGGDGKAGNGIHSSASIVIIRGSATDLIQPGYVDSCCWGWPGKGLVANDSVIVMSGASITNVAASTSIVIQPPIAEPYLEIAGSDVPGESRRLDLYGPAGELAVVATSLDSAPLALPGLEGLVWVDTSALHQVLPIAMLGQNLPAHHLWTVPVDPALAGLALCVQAGFPLHPGTLEPAAILLSNPARMVVRF
ncbi:MAG: hypothetical protein EPO68_16810 [Planctomycetota bacterium]|nr:MAG: hypothetical protein EPO68_16810 [Planctomycetota bacterium]